MALFSTNFSFAAPSSRPEHLYPLSGSSPLSDSISPTSSRATSPSSPYSPTSTVSSSTDDLFALTTHLSASSLYPSTQPTSCPPPRSTPALSGRRSPPRSNPWGLPPAWSGPTSGATNLPARRERRQAYVQDQPRISGRRKLSLLVARMLGDEVAGGAGARKHPNDGLHPSNVRVVAAVPACVRRNTLVEVQGEVDADADAMLEDGDEVVDSIEETGGVVGGTGAGIGAGMGRESANRVSKRRSGGRVAGRGRRLCSRDA